MTDNTEALTILDVTPLAKSYGSEWEKELDDLIDEIPRDPEDYDNKIEDIHIAMKSSIQPRDSLEVLYLLDLIEVTYEQFRLRLFKRAALEIFRQRAVAKLVRDKYIDGRLNGFSEYKLDVHVKEQMIEWESDHDKLEYEIGKSEVRIEEFAQGSVMLDNIERLLSAAQHKRGALLKEFWGRRDFVKRAREVSDLIVEGGLKALPKPNLAMEAA